MPPRRSYIIACTPRSGSHLLADGLTSTAIAGYPVERFPRFTAGTTFTPAQRDALVFEPPPESSYDAEQDRDYIERVLAEGTSANGVFGVSIHWFQVNDAVRRLKSYLQAHDGGPHEILSRSFPGLSYIWLRRRDKVAQAVSWYKAIQTGRYVKTRDGADSGQRSTPGIAFDYSAIQTYWTALRSSERGWERFFATQAIKPLVLDYETLCIDYEMCVRNVLDFLGLNAHGVAVRASRHEKAADAQSFEWTDRFKALLAAQAR
ncbi:MAG TPA: Stf0 family sulfotransferase [Steroidobacteraceae bacterium]